MLAASDIDPAVLADLPEDVAEEILSSFTSAQRQRLQLVVGKLRRAKAAQLARDRDRGEDLESRSAGAGPAARLAGLPVELQRVLADVEAPLPGTAEAVVLSLQGPNADWNRVADAMAWRLTQATRLDLEGVASALRILSRAPLGPDACELVQARIVNVTQRAVQARYGAPLLLKNFLD